MRTKDKDNYWKKLQRYDNYYFSEAERNYKSSEKQQFVVPWQMVIKKEEDFLIK